MTDLTDPWWPDGYADPAFVVRRQTYGTATGGDYVRGSSVTTLPATALRYPTTTAGFADIQSKAFLFAIPFDYVTAQVTWGWGSKDITETWSEVALVRSGMGYPTTPMDGQTVFRADKTQFTGGTTNTDSIEGTLDDPPVLFDQPLQSGQWYYYSLFFLTSRLNWVLGQTASVLIPRNFHHADHLWEALPPFYRWTDSNTREGNGFLRQFLAVFGFEMDLTREYVEQWQETYHIDKCPLTLLRRVGQNFGVPYRAGVGDARYRAMIAALPELLEVRGTPSAMKGIIEAGSKWECDVTLGTNLMLLPDDSDFATGTGNWATLHATTQPLASMTSVAPAALTLGVSTTVNPPYGRSVMSVQTTAATKTANLTIACGDGTRVPSGTDGRSDLIPLNTGIPIRPGVTYGFSVYVKEDAPCVTGAYLLWFDTKGQPNGYISRATPATLTAPADTNWYLYIVQGTAPANAVYVVPTLAFTTRPNPATNPFIYVAGASVYQLNDVGSVAVAPPDSYLTLGDPSEIIGDAQAPGAPGGFKESILGSP
jgi:hypothetical protein